MASWQAHCISFLLRHTFKKRLARAHDAQHARAILNSGRFRTPGGLRITELTLGGISCECIEAEPGSTAGTLFYLHGGGYFACSPRSHRPYTTFFAQHGFKVIAPAYRLAPENPFPAGLDDAVAAYRALRAQSGGAPIAMGGDSAGGGLALATMLRLRDEGDQGPAVGLLFSPLTDLVGIGKSRATNNQRCAMFFVEGLKRAAEFYLGGKDPHDPLASPLYADLKGLPPLLVHVGADETLLDDSTQLAERARAAGVSVELKVWPVVPHDWHLFRQFVPEGRKSLQEAVEFLEKFTAPAAR